MIVIVQLLKEQNKYDQMPSSLLDQLQRVLPLAAKVENEIVSEETEILDKIILRLFEIMQKVAQFLCEYVKHGRFSRLFLFWIPQMLIINRRANRRCADSFEGQRNDGGNGEGVSKCH